MIIPILPATRSARTCSGLPYDISAIARLVALAYFIELHLPQRGRGSFDPTNFNNLLSNLAAKSR
jgi:hypothetical protein